MGGVELAEFIIHVARFEDSTAGLHNFLDLPYSSAT